MKHTKNNVNIAILYSYIMTFIVFMGANFLKFDVMGVNMNVGRFLMIFTFIPLIGLIIKNKSIKILFTNKKMINNSLIFFLIWAIYAVLSITRSKDINNFFINVFFVISGTLTIFFIVNTIKEEKQLIQIFRIIEITMIINCIYTIYLKYIGQDVIGGFYFNNNNMATVLLLAVPIEIFLMYHSKCSISIIYRTTVLMLYVWVFQELDSRANLIGLILEIVIYVLAIIIVNRKKIFKKKWRKIFFGIFLVIFLFILIYTGSKVFNKIVGKISFEPKYTYLDSKNIRTNLILNGFELLKKNPIFGIGVGNIDIYLENEAPYPTKGITKFHNMYLEILVSYGIIIFALYILFYGAMCINLLKELWKDTNASQKMLSLTLLAFWGSFIVSCISSSSNLTKEWIWLLLGITLALIKGNSLKDGGKHE